MAMMVKKEKAIEQVVSASTLRFSKKITIMRSTVRQYKLAKPTKDGREYYDRLYLTFMLDDDDDDDDFLGGGTKTFMLNAKTDPAYAEILKAKRGDRGIMSFSVTEQITGESQDENGNAVTGSSYIGLSFESYKPIKA